MDVKQFASRMFALMPQIVRGFSRYEHNYLTKGEITLPQFWVLEYLAGKQASHMSHLAEFLHISPPAATGLVDRLIAQGLVARENDTNDRRIVLINLTVRGKRILTDIVKQRRRTVIAVFGQLSAEDRKRYVLILEQIAHILEAVQPATRHFKVSRLSKKGVA